MHKKLEIRSVERAICPIATLYSLAATYKGARCKQGAIIFHAGRVVVNFVPKFVAMATGVSRREIQMTPSDSTGPKIREEVKTASNYLSRVPSYSQFCRKNRCHGNRGQQGRNLNDTIG